MADHSKSLKLIGAGLAAGLTLGSIGVAGATPSPLSPVRPPAKSTGARRAHTFDTPTGSGEAQAGRRGVDPLAVVVAGLTRTDPADVTAARNAGKSYGEIAEANGVRADRVVNVATSRASAELAAAVRAERLAPSDGRRIMVGLRARLMALVAETAGPRA